MFAATASVAVPRPTSDLPADPASGAHASAPSAEPSAGIAAVSATAAVPMANRVTPPADPTARPASIPRPRVYGRPVQPEPAPVADPGHPEQQDQPSGGFPTEPSASGGFPPPQAWANPAQGQPTTGTGYGGPTTLPPPATDSGRPDWAPPAPFDTSPFGDSRPPFGDRPFGDSRPEAAPAPGQPDGQRPGEFGTPNGAASWASPVAPPTDDEQSRFDAFRPDVPAQDEPKAETPPTPQVRNGRVLLAVIVAAILIIVVPFGILYLAGWLRGESSGGNAIANVQVGDCVKQNGDAADVADCADPAAYKVTAKVNDKTQCGEPYVSLTEGGKEWFLCLQPAGQQNTSADPSGSPEPTTSSSNS